MSSKKDKLAVEDEEHLSDTADAEAPPDAETAQLNPTVPSNSSKEKKQPTVSALEEPELPKKQSSSPMRARDDWSYDESDNLEIKDKGGHTMYFRKKDAKGARKVYFAMKIRRFSDIDNVEESFRCRFHLYLDWIMTEEEYDKYIEVRTRD